MRRSGEPLLLFYPKPQLIGIMKDQQEADILSCLARAQVNQQNKGRPVREPNPNDEDLGDDDLINQSDRRRVEGVAVLVNKIHPFRGRTDQQAMQFDLDDNEDDMNGERVTGAIIPPPLAPKF